MKEKKQVCALLVTALILGMAIVRVSAGLQPPRFSVDPPTYTATQLGEVFTIDIKIANVTPVCILNFTLSYNTTLLDALDAVIGPFLPHPFYTEVEINETEGYVWVYVQHLTVSGSGTLATITFKATYAEPASCILDLKDTKLIDPLGTPIPHDVYDGNYEFVIPITVATDKLSYLVGENVEIHGNITLPYQGLMAIQVDDPAIRRMVVRTLQTGPTPPPGNITIAEVYPCDVWGQAKESFHRGIEVAYFNVSVINSGTIAKDITITVNVYDNDTVPFGVTSRVTSLLGPGWCYATFSVLLPEWISLGNATAYANVFTDYPRDGGIPYCPEKSAKFQIINSTAGAAAMEAQGLGNNPTAGNYSLTFKLSTVATRGVYRVYATTFYKRSIVSSTVFGVNAMYVPDHYPTIQGAVDAATPTNNSIIVTPGTYNEHVTVNKAVTLVGVDPSNTIINGSGTGTVVNVTSNNTEISRFTIQNGDKGIALKNSSHSTISENTIIENCYGIYLNSSSQENTIRGNTITSNTGHGIVIDSCDNNDVTDNTLSNNKYGIYLNNSTNSKLRNNIMTCNKYNFAVFGDSLSNFIHDIDASNTVDGKPVIYWLYQQNREVPPNAGFVAIVSSTQITLRGLDITKNGQGVLFAFTTDSLMERVNIIGNEYGIYLFNSQGNTIIGSSVSNNTVGVYQRYCSENIICHNNITNNTDQVDLDQSSNTWDDSVGKGNYWSDYTGVDDGSNNRTAGDGVGDTLLPHQGVDWYPLMNPYILVHDVAITNVTTIIPYDAHHVYPGWVVTVTLTVRNEGDFTEAFFNVIAYYDNTTIDTKTVTLPPFANTTLNFDWNTAGVPNGNYIISATATPVQNETETTDNTYTDGWVLVAKVGDANGDGTVNVLDVILVCINLGDVPPKRPECDINGDGTVNVMDVILVCVNLG